MARKEAHTHVQSQLEMLNRDRAAYMIGETHCCHVFSVDLWTCCVLFVVEKQRFDDERGAQNALIEGGRTLRAQLKSAMDDLMQREEEVERLKRNAERISAQRADEDKQIEEVRCMFMMNCV